MGLKRSGWSGFGWKRGSSLAAVIEELGSSEDLIGTESNDVVGGLRSMEWTPAGL